MRSADDPLAVLHWDTMHALRVEHPEWTEDVFAVYEARFSELLRALLGRSRHCSPKSVAQSA